jgi:hypothetical protein
VTGEPIPTAEDDADAEEDEEEEDEEEEMGSDRRNPA